MGKFNQNMSKKLFFEILPFFNQISIFFIYFDHYLLDFNILNQELWKFELKKFKLNQK